MSHGDKLFHFRQKHTNVATLIGEVARVKSQPLPVDLLIYVNTNYIFNYMNNKYSYYFIMYKVSYIQAIMIHDI